MLQKIRFETKGSRTHIFLDDKEVEGVACARMVWDVDSLPVVALSLQPLSLEVDADSAEVLMKDAKEVVFTDD